MILIGLYTGLYSSGLCSLAGRIAQAKLKRPEALLRDLKEIEEGASVMCEGVAAGKTLRLTFVAVHTAPLWGWVLCTGW